MSSVNRALESGAAAYVLAYILLDLGGAALLMLLLLIFNVNVQADFALAFAISKSPPLRGPRLALDSAAAACLTRLFPALAAVRTSLLADAMARLTAFGGAGGGGGGNKKSDDTAPSSRLANAAASAAAKARRAADEYGLAYLVVKNLFGPLSVGLIYGLIRLGGSASGGAASSGGGVIGRAAGAIARLSLGPGAGAFDGRHAHLPSVGQTAGIVALASTMSSLLFPLIVLGAAKLAPRLGAWVQRRVEATDEQVVVE